jgi:predicted RNA-binding Zn ribbon-like protein
VESSHDDPLALADPRLAVDLVGTLRHDRDTVVDQLADRRTARTWLRERLRGVGGEPDDPAELVRVRELIRELFVAVVDQTTAPASTVWELNNLAARAPVTLEATVHRDGTITVKRSAQGTPAAVPYAELARSALALLDHPARERLRLCRAPGCILYFLTQDPRQQWCSPNCGNRARVARHYARTRQP